VEYHKGARHARGNLAGNLLARPWPYSLYLRVRSFVLTLKLNLVGPRYAEVGFREREKESSFCARDNVAIPPTVRYRETSASGAVTSGRNAIDAVTRKLASEYRLRDAALSRLPRGPVSRQVCSQSDRNREMVERKRHIVPRSLRLA